MLVKILIILAIAVPGLGIAKSEGAFQNLGVTGSCKLVRGPGGDPGSWYACSEGFLTGFPSLIGDQCTYELKARGREYWRCDVPRAG